MLLFVYYIGFVNHFRAIQIMILVIDILTNNIGIKMNIVTKGKSYYYKNAI